MLSMACALNLAIFDTQSVVNFDGINTSRGNAGTLTATRLEDAQVIGAATEEMLNGLEAADM